MTREFHVRLGDKVVGKARVERSGLYYLIRIRCDIGREIMHKILVRCGTKEENLGTLIPLDGQFGVDVKLPVKKVGEGDMDFLVLPRHGELGRKLVPLSPEEPVRYITRLKNSYLERRGSEVGIMIEEAGCR